MKLIIIIISLCIVQVGYGQKCTSDIPHKPCSWAFNSCYYKEKMPAYKNKKIVDIKDFLFLEDCANCCAEDFQLDTIAPNFVKDLANIEVLKMPLISAFPSKIGELKSLKKLVQYPFHSESSYRFFYTKLPEIPADLWEMKSLESLALYTAKLTTNIQQLSSLRSLDLHIEDRFTENVLPEASTWQRLKQLETVWLYSDFLNEEDIRSLAGFKNLRSFSLLTNNEQDNFAYTCLAALKETSQTIEALVLTTNTYRYQRFYQSNLNDKPNIVSTKKQVFKEVDNALTTTTFPKLTKLILRDCSIKEFALKTLLFPQLEILDLSLNRLEKLEIEVNGISNIKALNLSYNYLSILPKNLLELNALEELDLRGNPLFYLPIEIENLPNLKTIILDDQMPPKMLAALKQRLGDKLIVVPIDTAREMDWSSDYFLSIEDRLKQDFSNEKWENDLKAKELRLLESISLAKNALTKIPKQIFACSKLKFLNLSKNELKGKLNRRIVQLKQLESLDLAGNYLNKLPCSIGRMKALKRLDLSFNCLHELPKTISNLKDLEYLSIANNPIEILPEELKNLKGIKEICISRDLPDALKKQLVEWFGKEKIVLVIDSPLFIEQPDFIQKLNVF